MSKNQEYQDNIEQRCLDFVKNDKNEKDCFGLSNKQYVELKKWLNEAKPNSNSTKFPDFVFKDGFIEHFAVTSSLENRKGAKQKRESIVFKKNSETNFLSNLDSIEEEILLSHSYGREFEEHTYFNIVNSIKKNWVKHIESYDKNISTSNHGIFLIEYIDINIETAVSRENERAEIFETYRISVDKHLLNWIYTYKEKIDYLIFVNLLSPSIEVIRIDNIPELIEGISNVMFAPTLGMETHKYVGFKIRKEDI
ncbi:hypothetical protein ACFOZ1_15885 [Gracilibacillus marinus]|uniref:Uncharacterized protein n=1 Tax=Gracilibacillus marinus TaxID=630535 RepID=A0ABV8VZD6_9BACI